MTLSVKVDDALPSVGLRASDGYLLNLRSFVTKSPAAFLFFAGPTATGTERRRGTQFLQALAAGHEQLREAGIAVAGVSCDSEEQQKAFADEHRLPFLLFSDERGTATHMLGIETTESGDGRNVARPLVIAVDTEGVIRAIVERIQPNTVVDVLVGALSEPMPPALPPASPEAAPAEPSAG